jgi:glucosamine 6-phosphate synthetase-like amidotransferase/phosphosugar isomerase protein
MSTESFQGRIGRTIVAVVPQGDTQIAPGADWVLPVVGDVDEVFSPMVYAVAAELYSAYLAEALGEPPFRAFNGVYADGGNTIKTSAVIESV